LNFQQFDSYINQNLDSSLDELKILVSQPSISAKRIGLVDCAKLVVNLFQKRGFEIHQFDNDGAPIIVAEKKGKSDRTILFYNHYDVQPAEPLRLWKSPPFELTINDGKAYGRGANDNKGNITNRLLAIDAILDEDGELPCSVKFIIEGEEETDSFNFAKFVNTHQDLLRADACIWEFGEVDGNDHPMEFLGLRGICYVELEVETAKRDIHSGVGGSIVANAAWRLIWALSTLKSEDEKINLPGFYDDIVPPSAIDMEWLAALPDMSVDYKKRFGVDHFLNNISGGLELQIAEVFQPTCTICGLSSGYHGQGSKTIVPARAHAKIDFRLVPNQRPEKVMRQLRTHLDQNGFQDIKITNLCSDAPARTDPNDGFIKTIIQTSEEVYGEPMKIVPMTGGSGPNAIIQDALKIPIASLGIGYPDSRVHAPNENIRLDLYLKTAKHITRILSKFGEQEDYS
jgi:acetylornithine deacetylase/succinyl-diaminopimelate desuccinylase-like protein